MDSKKRSSENPETVIKDKRSKTTIKLSEKDRQAFHLYSPMTKPVSVFGRAYISGIDAKASASYLAPKVIAERPFGILSCDIICHYYTRPESQPGWLTLAHESNYQSEDVDDIDAGYLSSLQKLYGLVPTAVVLAGVLGGRYLSQYYRSLAMLESGLLESVGKIALPLVTSAFTTRIAEGMMRKNTSAAAKKFERDTRARFHQERLNEYLPNQAELHSYCSNVYARLCRLAEIDFSAEMHPYKVRALYVAKEPYAVTEYLRLPHDIYELYTSQKSQNAEDIVTRWSRLITTLHGIVAEIGVVCALVVGGGTDLIPVVQPILRSLLDELYQNERETYYTQAISNLILSVVGSENRAFTNMTISAVLPMSSQRTLTFDPSEQLALIQKACLELKNDAGLDVNIYDTYFAPHTTVSLPTGASSS